jgi:hypothetical protein
LHFLTDLDTAAAAYTFFRIEYDGRVGIVYRQGTEYLPVGALPDTEFRRQSLEFALAVPGTLEAVVGMVGKDEFQYRAAYRDDLRIVGDDAHTFRHCGRTGPDHPGRTFHPDYADPAGSPRGQVRVITKGRNLDIGFPGSNQDRCPFLHFKGYTVYFKVNHNFSSFPE